MAALARCASQVVTFAPPAPVMELMGTFAYTEEGVVGEHWIQFANCTLLKPLGAYEKGQTFGVVRFEWNKEKSAPQLCCYVQAADATKGVAGASLALEMACVPPVVASEPQIVTPGIVDPAVPNPASPSNEASAPTVEAPAPAIHMVDPNAGASVTKVTSTTEAPTETAAPVAAAADQENTVPSTDEPPSKLQRTE